MGVLCARYVNEVVMASKRSMVPVSSPSTASADLLLFKASISMGAMVLATSVFRGKVEAGGVAGLCLESWLLWFPFANMTSVSIRLGKYRPLPRMQ